jgi:outer membrane protein assembly factor BamB
MPSSKLTLVLTSVVVLALAIAGASVSRAASSSPTASSTASAAAATCLQVKLRAPDPAARGAAVAYQVNPGHSGFQKTDLKLPLKEAWRVPLGGGISYPLIVAGKVFVTVANTNGNGTTLYALNAADGKTVWTRDLSGSYHWSALAYDYGRIFALAGSGRMTAFVAANGKQAWTKQLPGQYAFTSAPTANRGYVYTGGAGSGGTVYTVRESDGKVMCTNSVENGDQSSPAVSEDSFFVAYACAQIYGYRRTTSKLLWHHSTGCEGGGGKTAAYSSGLLFTRDFSGGNLILNSHSGKVVGGFNSSTIPALDGNVGYFLNGGTLAVRPALGAQLWWSFNGDGKLVTAPLVVATPSGKVAFVASSAGTVYGLDAVKGGLRWQADVGSEIPGPDEQNVSQPLTGLGAGQGLLVVPAAQTLVAYR